MAASKQASKHTHVCAQCSPTSVEAHSGSPQLPEKPNLEENVSQLGGNYHDISLAYTTLQK